MSHDLHESLRDNVRILGDSLGRTIADDLGQSFVDKIETIRAHAKRGRQGDSLQQRQLIEYLRQLPERNRLPCEVTTYPAIQVGNASREYPHGSFRLPKKDK